MQVPIKNSRSSNVPHPQNIKCINIADVFYKEILVFLIIDKNFSSFIFHLRSGNGENADH